ncbi:Translin family [Geosmithia morbida]|uniref:Translin family n=1 Tax=Geosmithia morbida TaxID=1094350 RepID=A0A9P4YXJ8_9HYPO|nr:Translin family [Geosmithia morbida]KAF4124926.1 Translin family [Geosmithia morbida]
MSGGIKRDHNGNTRSKDNSAQDAPRGRFHDMFEDFRDELDEHYDRRERIIKASRDITALSKKIVKKLNQDFPPSIQREVDSRLSEISKLIASIGPDLQSIKRYRYGHNLRGLEELVEALSFAHYLRHQTIITPAEAQAAIPADVLVAPHDYLYGVFDLFGEMMRFATVTTAQTGRLAGGGREGEGSGSGGRNILADIHELGCAYEMLPEVPTKDYGFKMEAMRQSIAKVEKLGYGLVVRGSERPKGWLPDLKDDV